jgi:hypothetical protein
MASVSLRRRKVAKRRSFTTLIPRADDAVRLYTDENCDSAVICALSDAGHDIATVREELLGTIGQVYEHG